MDPLTYYVFLSKWNTKYIQVGRLKPIRRLLLYVFALYSDDMQIHTMYLWRTVFSELQSNCVSDDVMISYRLWLLKWQPTVKMLYKKL